MGTQYYAYCDSAREYLDASCCGGSGKYGDVIEGDLGRLVMMLLMTRRWPSASLCSEYQAMDDFLLETSRTRYRDITESAIQRYNDGGPERPIRFDP